MSKRKLKSSSVLIVASISALAFSKPSFASGLNVTEAAEPPAEVIVVTGTRFGGRIASQSVVPIDTIGRNDLEVGGRNDLTSMLKVAAPSLNTPRTAGSSYADFALPVTLRGLSSGQILVLVNGKRRHTLGELNQSNSVGRGDITYDLNAIPSVGLSRVEVLRDGAGAQYGSDAIAGVINLVLDETAGFRASLTTRVLDKGDGQATDLSLSYGFETDWGGKLRISGQYLDQGRVSRTRPDTRQQYFGSASTRAPSAFFGSGTGLTPSAGTLDPREATIDRNVFKIGESPYTRASVLLNGEMPVGSLEAYGFANYSRLDGRSDGFFRRAGQDENVRTLYPDGYRPATNVAFDDFTISAGLRSGNEATLQFDISTTYGGVKSAGDVVNSVNPSLGAASPREFYRGGTDSRHWTTTFDLKRSFELGLREPLRLAFGAEFRKEFFDLIEGDLASYQNGGIAILDGPNIGRFAPVGAQPVPGTTNTGALSVSRDSRAIYGELEQVIGEKLTLVGAVRYEDYSDFGDTTDFKLSARFAPTDWIALRANYGTGFRAPGLTHSFFNSTVTSFAGGQQVLVRVFRVGEPAAALVGAQPLRPEKSNSTSFGGVLTLANLTASLDAYEIEIDDRIVISSQFEGTGLRTLLANNGFPGVNAASFLTNAVDSVTRGVDFTANYKLALKDEAALTFGMAANFNESKLKRISGTPAPLAALGITTPLFDLTQQIRFTDSQPRDKVALSINWQRGPFSLRTATTRYGEVAAVALTNRTPAQVAALTPGYKVKLLPVSSTSPNFDIVQVFGAKALTDLEASYRFTDSVRVTFGITNLLDVYPDENIASTIASVAAGTNGSDNAGTVPYNSISPFGFSGRGFFASIGVAF